MKTFEKWLASALDVVALVSSALVAVLLLYLVIARYFLGWSAASVLELSSIFAIQLYMVGAIISSRQKDQLTVDFLSQQITSPKAQAIHEAVISIVVMIACVFFLFMVYKMLAWAAIRPQYSPILLIPLWIPQLSIGLAAIFCFGYGLRDMLSALRRARGQ